MKNELLTKSQYNRIYRVLAQTYLEDGILHLPNIQISDEDYMLIYKFFRASLLDGYIPLRKPIGFYINRTFAQRTEVLPRETNMLESLVTLIENMSKLIIVDKSPTIVNTKKVSGKVRACNLVATGETPIRFLDPEVNIFTSYSDVGLVMLIDAVTGFRVMEDNAVRISQITQGISVKASDFIPLNTHSSLCDYIRILPFDYTTIRYTIDGLVQEEDLNKIWKEYIEHYSVGGGK